MHAGTAGLVVAMIALTTQPAATPLPLTMLPLTMPLPLTTRLPLTMLTTPLPLTMLTTPLPLTVLALTVLGLGRVAVDPNGGHVQPPHRGAECCGRHQHRGRGVAREGC